MTDHLLDFSVLVPEKVTVTLGDEDETQEVNLAALPAKATFRMMEAMEKDKSGNLSFREWVPVVSEVCMTVNPAVTEQWLCVHTTAFQLRAFTKYLIVYTIEQIRKAQGVEPQEKAAGRGAEKNLYP